MKYLFLFLSLMSSVTASVWAKDLSLECQLKHNHNLVSKRDISLRHAQKNVLIGGYDLFEVFVSSIGPQKIELQIYNAAEPARSYASGLLTDKSSEVSMALWTREFLMEASCSLK